MSGVDQQKQPFSPLPAGLAALAALFFVFPAITAEVPPAAVDELKLDDGGQLWASVDPAAIMVYPP